jgi:tetratricopeptide (TPR) repeat protein
MGVALNQLGMVAEEQGDLDSALDYLQESLAIHQELGIARSAAYALANIASVQKGMGNRDEAHRLLRQSMQVQLDYGERGGIAIVLERYGELAVADDEPERVLHFVAAGRALRRALGEAESPFWFERIQKAADFALVKLGTDRAHSAMKYGEKADLNDVVKDAMTYASMKSLGD